MFTEITLFTLISTLALFSFIGAGVVRFGLLPSYSAYSSKWGQAVPMNNMNLWSVVTFVAAFLLCPALLELGAASMWQFLGFLTPVYLITVSLTPEWQTKLDQYKVHMIAAVLCATGGLGWLIFVMHALKVLGCVFAFIMTMALFSGTAKTSAIFWLEMFMFLSVYSTVLLAIL